ncbi:MAG TPA: pseudaminic acid cytidylyltransferase [Bacteroides sp.]|nr:pseudaminic acid cytidylyltransferase [Bacteroides sp.]
MNKILIIPARIGSKRISEKNIRSFHGKPIIAYSIEAALKSELFETVMVSTDSNKIGDLARKYGAEVPFLRSLENSDDQAGLAEVLIEVLDNYSYEYDVTCCLLPTAPLISVEKLHEADLMMVRENLDAVITVQEFSYPIDRALYLSGNKAAMIRPENYKKRSQDLKPAYHDAGQFYFIKTKVLKSDRMLFPRNCGAIVLNELEAHDIDNPLDWIMAEIKYKQLKRL